MLQKHSPGFTLAELLVALLILGQIATFTIPKIISAQQRGQNNAKAKETMAMVSGAYQQYLLNSTISASTTLGDFTQYMNYVSVQTTGRMDDHVGFNVNYTCGTNATCLKLHNGGVLYTNNYSFGGTATTNAILAWFDPDGVYTGGTTDGASKSVAFFIYTNNRLTSRATALTNTTSSNAVHTSEPTADPSWFSW